MLIELTDGGLIEVISSSWDSSGCDTCNYGSSYVNDFTLKLTRGALNVEVDTMYGYALSEGSLMEILLPNIEEIKRMSEESFIEWIKLQVTEKANEDSEVESIKFDFKNAQQ